MRLSDPVLIPADKRRVNSSTRLTKCIHESKWYKANMSSSEGGQVVRKHRSKGEGLMLCHAIPGL